MVLVLLLLLFLALVSVGLWAYSRSLLTSAAADAARYAASFDIAQPGPAAARRATEIMSHTPVGSTARTIVCTGSAGASGGLMVEVRCTMKAPGLVALLDGVLPEIAVTGHALRER